MNKLLRRRLGVPLGDICQTADMFAICEISSIGNRADIRSFEGHKATGLEDVPTGLVTPPGRCADKSKLNISNVLSQSFLFPFLFLIS